MKKLVKSLIISASVAAIAGIGAVSFAAWESGRTTANVESNTTGTVSVVGFGNQTITKAENLMPWDQASDELNGGTNVADYALPEVTSSVGYKITVTMEGANEWAGKLYVIIDGTATGTASDPEAESAAWKAINGTDSVFTFTATGDTAQQLYAHVILDSDKLSDMGQSYSLTFTIAENA